MKFKSFVCLYVLSVIFRGNLSPSFDDTKMNKNWFDFINQWVCIRGVLFFRGIQSAHFKPQ